MAELAGAACAIDEAREASEGGEFLFEDPSAPVDRSIRLFRISFDRRKSSSRMALERFRPRTDTPSLGLSFEPWKDAAAYAV